MAEDKTFELMKILKERQDKFVYYITGINVAALGFTLSKTFDLKINSFNHFYHVFLVIALLSWMLSVVTSLKWIIIQFRSMVGNLNALEYINGFYDKNKLSEEDAKKETRITNSKLQEYTQKGEKVMRNMLMFFLTGMVFFIFWRVFILFY